MHPTEMKSWFKEKHSCKNVYLNSIAILYRHIMKSEKFKNAL